MLRSLYIRDFALIEELDVEFDSGLNIITGETGAGKSILIGALKLILGERASSDYIRTGSKKAIVEGVFDNTGSPRVQKLLKDYDFDSSTEIILRREITASQSRAFINDTPANLQIVREVASHLIDLHGQHEHQLLLRTETHIEMLDNFGGLEGLVGRYKKQYARVSQLCKERDALIAKEKDLQQQKELFQFQVQEIDEVSPEEDEESKLEVELQVLEHAERLFEVTNNLYQILYEADNAVGDQLVRVRNELQDIARVDPELEHSAQEAESAQIIVTELAKFLQDYNARIEFNSERLESIRSRLGDIENLKRKYGGTLSAVIAYRKEIGVKYDLARDFEGTIATLNEQILDEQKGLSTLAFQLSNKRSAVAKRIEGAIVAELAKLGMEESRFDVRIQQLTSDSGWVIDEDNSLGRLEALGNGIDIIEFYISTNPGEDLKPLAAVASGGEISRIMLSLKTTLAKSERLPILVFDEIDTGISGPIARKVGENMKDLAKYHQIVAITHLPQIASLGDIHFRVSKHVDEGRTRTQVQRLTDEQHAMQVATLISGEEVTDAAMESARELIASVQA